MNIPVIGGITAIAVMGGLIMRSNPTLSSTDARVILNCSVNTVTLVGARIIQESGDSVVLAGADGVQVSAYGVILEETSLQGDATLSRNGNGWNLVKFKGYASPAQAGTLTGIRQTKTGVVYGIINPDSGGTVRVKFNESGAWK